MPQTPNTQEMYDRLARLGSIEQDLIDLKEMKWGGEQFLGRSIERAGLRIALAIAAAERLLPHS